MENETIYKGNEKNRIHHLLSEWKKQKAEEEREAKEAFNTPGYQAMLEELRKENAAKGIAVSK